MRFLCPSCSGIFEPGRGRPHRVTCPLCGVAMEQQAEVVELHPTQPYDLAQLRRGADQIWFVGVHGRSVGPLTSQGLQGLRERGQLHPASLVWREGWPVWAAADAVPEVREVLGLPPAGSAKPPEMP